MPTSVSDSPSLSPGRTTFQQLRYAQVWEDADVLVEALGVRSGGTYLSIASAGDNALALLARGAGKVVAVDLNPAQIACAELRVAAFRRLAHGELLELVGSREATSERRRALYQRCRADLSEATRRFWDARPGEVAAGVGGAGKFERYFALFRRWVLPLIHGLKAVRSLLEPGKDRWARERFYAERWDTWRWRALFRLFFSRAVMGRLGRDPSFFRYVEGSVADRILARTRHAVTVLDPARNPYLRWILTGRHSDDALPFALREENFAAIRANVDRLELRGEALEAFCANSEARGRFVDGFNLSDVFEYLSPEASGALLERLAATAAPGARFVYWNLLAPRCRPEKLADRLLPLDALARELHARDQAFFYSALVVEERTP